jgi:hypothetical protein
MRATSGAAYLPSSCHAKSERGKFLKCSRKGSPPEGFFFWEASHAGAATRCANMLQI